MLRYLERSLCAHWDRRTLLPQTNTCFPFPSHSYNLIQSLLSQLAVHLSSLSTVLFKGI